jgi:hypothetical protein
VTERAAAELLSVSVVTLRNARRGRGLLTSIPYFKIGKLIRYDITDLLRYLDTCRVTPGI